MIIADTSVWIAFQRNPDSSTGRELNALLRNNDVAIIGPVLMEMLQGARTEDELHFLEENLSALQFIDADQTTWLNAGELSYRLKRQGITLPFADVVISAIALQYDAELFTLDSDFRRVPGLRFHEPEV